MVNFFKRENTIILILIILAIATFLRMWQLDLIPPGLYPDEAMNGNDALDSLEGGRFRLFYPENNGREGLFIWLVSFSFAVFGPSIWALKFVPASIGILTVFGLYLLTKELASSYIINENKFPRRQNRKKLLRLRDNCLALFSSFFLAISFWHLNFSRIGFRAILVPFILVFAFYFLFRGFRKKEMLNLAISGVILGLGFYTYISYRFVVLLEIAALFCWGVVYKKQRLQKEFLRFAVCCLLFTFIVALPIGVYFLKNPQDFIGRAADVSIFNQGNPIYHLGKSIIAHLGMFNFFGDTNWRHNLAGSPQLFWPVGIFFLIGIIISIKELIISIKRKNHLSLPNCFLLSWFFIMLLPGFLSAEGIPHALRTIGVIPVVYIFVGIGAFFLLEKIKNFYRTKKQTISFCFLILIFLGSIIYASFNKYFFQWAKNPEVAGAFSKNYVKIGNFLNSLPPDIHKYVIVNQPGVPVPWPNGIPMPAQTPMFIERTTLKARSIYLKPEDVRQIKFEKKTTVVIMKYDEDLFFKIYRLSPQGDFQKKEDFWIYQL